MCESKQQSPIRFRRLRSWEELEALFHCWRDLLEDSQSPTIFSTPEWLGAWWRAFAKNRELTALVLLAQQDSIVGIVPLYLDSIETPLGLRLQRLRFVGDGTHDSDNLDLIFRRGHEESCVAALFDWLSSESTWDVCELNTMPATSAALPLLVSSLRKNRWCFSITEIPCSRIALPSSWDAYLNQISKKEKKKINYLTKRLENLYAVSIDKCVRESDLPTRLENLFELHQGRWKTRGASGTFASEARREFYYDIGAAFLKRDWLEFWELRLGEKVAATQFCFRYRDTAYALQEGFDLQFSSESVGYVLRASVLKTLISDGVSGYDFLGGKDASKERWGAQVGNYFNIHFARPLSRGSLYLNLVRSIRSSKGWLKSRLPPSILNLIRKCHRALRAALLPRTVEN